MNKILCHKNITLNFSNLSAKPSPVELLKPEVGTRYSIIIKWKKPRASDRITGYQILLNNGFVDTFKADGNTVQREITNLKQNTKYTVEIRARNPSGYSLQTSRDVFKTDKGLLTKITFIGCSYDLLKAPHFF